MQQAGSSPKSTSISVVRGAFSRSFDAWGVVGALTALLLAIPGAVIVFTLFGEPGRAWQAVLGHTLTEFMGATGLLLAGVGLLSCAIGVLAAWFVTTSDFPGRRVFQWALVAPLALPAYIAAYAWAGLMDHTSLVQTLLRSMGLGFRVDVMNLPGLIAVMTLVLYPYVYVSARVAFQQQALNQLESARLLSGSPLRTFTQVAVPAARPAIAGGLFLVCMEVLNDYGAASYYGVNTFTTGIFRAWFSYGDVVTAVRLSACLMLAVMGLIMLERYQRRNVSVANAGSGRSKPSLYRPRGWQKWGLAVFCAIPVLLGFVLPCVQLLSWAWYASSSTWGGGFARWAINSLALAGSVAALCAGLSFGILAALRRSRQRGLAALGWMTTVGYAIPGPVVAIGVLVPLLALDRFLQGFVPASGGGLLVTGSLLALCYACTVRYMAVAFHPIDSGYKKIGRSLVDAARVLPHGALRALAKIDFPLVRGGMVGGALLVFVDMMKELPITLLLRPFNVNTLATKAYELAVDERLGEAAIPSLVLVAVGLGPVVWLSKMLAKAGEKPHA